MESIFKTIKEIAQNCSENKDTFFLPKIDGCTISESDYSSGGSTLYGKQYEISNDKERIVVTVESKDKCRTFEVRPDMNIVKIKHYGETGNIISEHSESWEDKY